MSFVNSLIRFFVFQSRTGVPSLHSLTASSNLVVVDSCRYLVPAAVTVVGFEVWGAPLRQVQL